ncbi:MAG: hypothetical protein PHT97_10850 [Methanoculleus sp.]|uniref:hypothetical protein n=1 Tax=Methanoculleus sp. TaxID=90427 RepID=UPI00261D2E2F|nr:hypothetical protein [Methanoculleus sp.]MDD2255199.1 hypothetical protein [Methanoculleus sp.]MDD4471639.1 hypothetical protein [Methanoculleus sp.]
MTMKYFEATTSDKDILRQEVMRTLIYRQAESMIVGANACMMVNVGSLDLKFDLPKTTMITPQQIEEMSEADLQRIGFYQINTSLDKYQTRLMISDETKARQLANEQVNMSLAQAAKGIAFQKDSDIFTTLVAASGNSVACDTVWTDPTADIMTDVADMIAEMLDSTMITEADINNLGIYYPAKLFGYMSRPIQIGEVQMTLKNWAQREFNIKFFATRQLTDRALAVIKGTDTAYHFTYTGKAVPLTEFKRQEGVGDTYIFTQYFKSKAIPYAQNQTTCKKIGTFTGIL